nr:iron-sulfur protein ind1 [Quercus suber]
MPQAAIVAAASASMTSRNGTRSELARSSRYVSLWIVMTLLLGGFLSLPNALRAEALGISSRARCFSTTSALNAGGHENPLGLPRSGTPPNVMARMKRGLPEKRPIPRVSKVVAVSSAKGGVGKSTIAANLALASARQGLEPELDPDNRLVPLTAYGIKAMSMGFLVPQDAPIAWRGLMVQKAMNQLLYEVSWPHLDLLILDLPPGTGDVQLTITQSIELAGAVIVTTPQDLALRDAVRGVDLFRKVNVPILGMIQNMSSFTCSACGHNHDIFGLDGTCRESPVSRIRNTDCSIGGTRKCAEMGLTLLGDIPLHAEICRDADAGKPTVVGSPDGPQAKAFHAVVEQLRKVLGI